MPVGYYNDDTTSRTINKCPIGCKTCILDSVNNNNLCTLCDVDNQYYYKLNDPSNKGSYYKCYHKNDVQTKYYLEDNIFKPCYSKCKTCNGEGTKQNNKCTECNDNDNYILRGENCICRYYNNYEQTECIEEIPDGYYNNDTILNTIDKCPTECKSCTLDSLNKNLCCL